MILDLSRNDARSLAEQILQKGGTVRIRCLGHSMSPLVSDGDVAVIEDALPDRYEKGDIVLVARGESLYLHRIVCRRGPDDAPALRTRGDNVIFQNPEEGTIDIIGRLASLEREGQEISLRGVRWRLLDLLSRSHGSLRRSGFPPKRFAGVFLYEIAFLVRRIL
jgi:hypothetical protein